MAAYRQNVTDHANVLNKLGIYGLFVKSSMRVSVFTKDSNCFIVQYKNFINSSK